MNGEHECPIDDCRVHVDVQRLCNALHNFKEAQVIEMRHLSARTKRNNVALFGKEGTGGLVGEVKDIRGDLRWAKYFSAIAASGVVLYFVNRLLGHIFG